MSNDIFFFEISNSLSLTMFPYISSPIRRDWEPGIRVRRKLTQKEHAVDIQSSSSLIRSRSNSHSGKKEPKSGEGNGSVVQDSGFSTETSSSKETHSASSTSGGAISTTTTIHHIVPPINASSTMSAISPVGSGSAGGTTLSKDLSSKANVSSSPGAGPHRTTNDGEDELWNLLDVIHRKSMRLRDEVDHLQTVKSSSNGDPNKPVTFQDQLDRISRNDVQILRKERDRLLEKLFQMEGNALADRIRTDQLQDSVDTLQSMKRDLEEQLKLALTQKIELSSRIHDIHPITDSSSTAKYRHHTSKTTISSSPPTASDFDDLSMPKRPHLDPSEMFASANNNNINNNNTTSTSTTSVHSTTAAASAAASSLSLFAKQDSSSSSSSQLGRLDGVVSSPNRGTRVRVTDSKKFAAILLETNIVELRRHLLTITVQNQVGKDIFSTVSALFKALSVILYRINSFFAKMYS